jgi:hypothetical protein
VVGKINGGANIRKPFGNITGMEICFFLAGIVFLGVN